MSNNKLQFKKSVDWDNVNNQDRPKVKNNNYSNYEKLLIQRKRAKNELIKKYNMSEDEAERTLQNIERKAKEKRNQTRQDFEKNNLQQQRLKKFIEEDDNNIIIPEHVKLRENKRSEQYPSPQRKKQLPKNTNKEEAKGQAQNDINMEYDFETRATVQSQQYLEEKTIKKEPVNVKENIENKEAFIEKESIKTNEKEENIENELKNKNVDDIISDIIPDYHKHTSIEVKDISLTFEIEKDKIDNLKEYVIRSIKRTKKEKFHIHALRDISFKVYKGEKIGIIGYNGAGKSTLLNVIIGIYQPDKGCVKTNGKISPMLSLGAGFDHNYTGRENIFLNGAVLGYDKKFLKSKVDEIIEFSELGEYIDIPIKNYSSGMLAKLGFSIATIVDPDILIIDEVLGVGDVTFRKKSSDKIKSLMDGKTTVLLVSHSIGQIRELCDKAIWIDHGRMVEFGEVNEVCDHYLKDAEKATKEQLKDIQLR